MTDRNPRKQPFSPRSPALVQAIRRALSPARVAEGLLAVSLTGLTAPALALELSDLNGRNGFAINGSHERDASGRSVSDAGDINGDGIDDLIIGAPSARSGYAFGQSYVVFGTRSGFPAALELADLDGRNGFAINGININDASGWSVSGAGDVNGDGIADLILGAPQANPNGTYSGQSYVVFGRRSGFPAALELSALNGTNGFTINGINVGDNSGYSVSGAGDVNGDGLVDLIIGAPAANSYGVYSGSGQSYVVFGSRSGFPAALELSALNGTNGFRINGLHDRDYSGWSVSGAGDVNGDGIADLLIGAGAPQIDQSYVVFGRQGGFTPTLNLSALDGTNGFTLNGRGRSGSVSGAGDVNGDGIADLIIGAPEANPSPSRTEAGQSYVVFGRRSGFPPALTLTDLNGRNGFTINGLHSRGYSGRSVSGAGDVNGDGLADLLIGADRVSPGGKLRAGQSYVVFGALADFPAVLELRNFNGGDGFMLNGINAYDYSGRSVSGAGDVNGDGIADLIIGAPWADPNGSYSGQSYVVFGKSAGSTVAIDIQPGTDPNQINLSRNDRLPVAILGTSTFDATQVDPATVQFGPNRARDIPARRQITDIDSDGDLDLVLRFSTRNTGIQCSDTQATLIGMTFTGGVIRGTGNLQTIGCQPVTIDIKPGITPNRINPNRQARLPVAILTTATFDATQVNPRRVRFGPTRAQEIRGRQQIKDIDGDGDLDLVLRFRVLDTGLICDDTQATLAGMTFTGQAFIGADTVRTVGCRRR